VEANHFDPDAVSWNQRLVAQGEGGPLHLTLRKQQLPAIIPHNWTVTPLSVSQVSVHIDGALDMLLPSLREFEIKAAGQLPTGFDPGKLYQSRNHPRGLQMMVYAASDALGSLGISWEHIQQRVAADQISVYAGSAMGQLD